ncbi:MAG TPA: glucosyl transferase [Ignavibacteriaceae bacterium]|nr:glucosyl transferase [Ignavibacteriaceae bacterium]
MSLNSLTKLLALLLLPLLFSAVSCNKPTEPHTGNLTITVEDASCTEVWLAVNTGNLSLPNNFVLYENNTRKKDITLTQGETVIVIENLLPKQNYSYKLMNSDNVSNETLAITLDTTSHNFTWETFEFGEYGNSVLYDVAIIDENNIWAVGEIYMNDSLGNPDHNAYNAVHWDGQSWELKRIKTNACGGVDYPPVKAIFAFSSSDILFAHIDGSISNYNGIKFTNDCSLITQLNGSANKIWGKSNSDFYVVSGNGFIAHWNGSSWKKIESGTNVDLLDVWGTPDGSIVWVSGNNLNKTVLIKIENSKATIVFESHYPWQVRKGRISGGISSIWTDSKNFIYATTHITVYRCLSNTNGDGKEIYPYEDYLKGGTVRIRGTAANDIVTCGSNGSILHYNGYRWQIEHLTDASTYLWSSTVKEGVVVAVGDRYEGIFDYRAVIIVGKK